jgi:hypothetical protein
VPCFPSHVTVSHGKLVLVGDISLKYTSTAAGGIYHISLIYHGSTAGISSVNRCYITAL